LEKGLNILVYTITKCIKWLCSFKNNGDNMKNLLRKKESKKEQGNKKNYDWFIKKAKVSKLQGQWIAVENEKVVVHDSQLQNVLNEVNKNWPNASITKVPKRGQILVL